MSNAEVVQLPPSQEEDDITSYLTFLEVLNDLGKLDEADNPLLQDLDLKNVDLLAIKESINEDKPIVYFSLEYYDQENNHKGGGGLGILAADTRRVCEMLGIPFVIVTPFYREESYQTIVNFKQEVKSRDKDPNEMHNWLGRTAINSIVVKDNNLVETETVLDKYDRKLGSTRILAITEENIGELYQGDKQCDHRLYQQVALGFGGYKALKEEGIDPTFTQLNEAPTVFAAIAKLDDQFDKTKNIDEAIKITKEGLLFTNHTLVPAVEGIFNGYQFNKLVMPNIRNEEVKNWIWGLFNDDQLPLSKVALELAGEHSGVSKLHANISSNIFPDRYGNRIDFKAVTNGISRKWTHEAITKHYHDLDILDDFDLPAPAYKEKLENITTEKVTEFRTAGREYMNQVFAQVDKEGNPLIKDQYGNAINIPEGQIVYDFKRRFVSYKRASMMFKDPNLLANILEDKQAHLILTGKPHPTDGPMVEELRRLLEDVIDKNDTLKERVHYLVDYDEKAGKALSIGADCAINVPKVGDEACGTSWMKDLSNFKPLISTNDGGVADKQNPISYLLVEGSDEEEETKELYRQMINAAEIIRDPVRLRDTVVGQLKEYMPVISGSRMQAAYLALFSRSRTSKEVELVEAVAA